MTTSYFLVSHGSSDPRHLSSLKKVREILGSRSGFIFGIGTLEVTPISLHEQLCQFASYSISLGCTQVQILPLFLLSGVHVQEDIPSEVRIAQAVLGERIKLNIRPYLGGKIEELTIYLRAKMAQYDPLTEWILFSHGTKRLGGHQSLEKMANQLGVSTAYWSVSPSLSEVVIKLVKEGHIRLGILPYFLFSGGITDKIIPQVEQFKLQFPGVEFYISSPLEPTPQLGDIIVKLMTII